MIFKIINISILIKNIYQVRLNNRILFVPLKMPSYKNRNSKNKLVNQVQNTHKILSRDATVEPIIQNSTKISLNTKPQVNKSVIKTDDLDESFISIKPKTFKKVTKKMFVY